MIFNFLGDWRINMTFEVLNVNKDIHDSMTLTIQQKELLSTDNRDDWQN